MLSPAQLEELSAQPLTAADSEEEARLSVKSEPVDQDSEPVQEPPSDDSEIIATAPWHTESQTIVSIYVQTLGKTIADNETLGHVLNRLDRTVMKSQLHADELFLNCATHQQARRFAQRNDNVGIMGHTATLRCCHMGNRQATSNKHTLGLGY